MEARHAHLTMIHHTCHIRVLLYIQVFTFMHMGGTPEHMEVRMIGNASQLLTESFNAAEAQCFKKEDRQKFLALIESAFGDIRGFNREVRKMLDRRLHRRFQFQPIWSTAEIELARHRQGLKTIVRTWRRRSRATPQKSYCPSTETKGDCTASNEVRPIGHTNDGSLILEEAT